eukprot:975460_1
MTNPQRSWFFGPSKFKRNVKYEMRLPDNKWHVIDASVAQEDSDASIVALTTRDTKQVFNYLRPAKQPKLEYVGPCRLRKVTRDETTLFRYKQSHPYSALVLRHAVNNEDDANADDSANHNPMVTTHDHDELVLYDSEVEHQPSDSGINQRRFQSKRHLQSIKRKDQCDEFVIMPKDDLAKRTFTSMKQQFNRAENKSDKDMTKCRRYMEMWSKYG